ncbi:MAG TPA: hypothetical protein VIJ09_07025 [Acidimicrobiales bacterium]|jgi:hypothetical protein
MTQMVLRCTAKILKLLGPDALETAGSSVAPHDDDWYMNLLWLDGRKCLLVTHAGTKFSAFVPDVRVAALRSIGGFTTRLIEHELDSEGLPLDTFGRLDPANVRIAKTADRSVLGCMNDLGQLCRFAVEDAGGLERCDIGAINRRLRRTILGPLGSNHPIELVFQRVGDLGASPTTVPSLSDVCRDCGTPDPRASIDGDHLCDRCADRRIAHHTGYPELPDPPSPMVLSAVDGRRITLRFRLRRAPTGVEMELEDASLEPRQGFHLAVLGSHDADIAELEAHLRRMAKEELGTRYLAPNKHRAGWILAEEHDELRGRLVWHDGSEVGTPYDVVIDGKTLSWEELGQALEAYEGWRFVLRLDDPCDDVRPDASVLPLRQVPKTPGGSA